MATIFFTLRIDFSHGSALAEFWRGDVESIDLALRPRVKFGGGLSGALPLLSAFGGVSAVPGANPDLGWHLDLHGDRKVVGVPIGQDFHGVDRNSWRNQNVVELLGRPPAGESPQSGDGFDQPCFGTKLSHLNGIRCTVHVAHHDNVGQAPNPSDQVLKLSFAPSAAQCQMHNENIKTRGRVIASKTGHESPAAFDSPWKLVVVDRRRADAAEKDVAVSRDAAHPPIRLLVVVLEAGAIGKVVCLVQKATAQTAGVDFLETHQVVAGYQVGDPGEVLHPRRDWNQMLPTTRQVVRVTLRGEARLDVIA